MKYCITIILAIITTAFRSHNQTSFSIEINYLGLPSTPHCHYFITDRNITVKKYVNAIPGRPRLVLDSASFELKQLDSISNVVFKTDWKKTPKVQDNHCIDGTVLDINLLTLQDTLNFKYRCARHPDIDRLLRICNSLIPSKKYRNMYRLVDNN